MANLIRNVHHWTAHVMMVTLLLHVLRRFEYLEAPSQAPLRLSGSSWLDPSHG